MTLHDLGIDRRMLALLVGGTVAAAGIGYVAAAALDGGRAGAGVAVVAPPPPAFNPEVGDNTPQELPLVEVPSPAAPGPGPGPAPPPDPDETPPPVEDPVAAEPEEPPPATTTVKPPVTKTTGPDPAAEPPGAGGQPVSDDNTTVPFRPSAPSTPLTQYTIEPAEIPPTDAAARVQLNAAAARPGATAATKRDIAFVLNLDRTLAGSRFPGRRAAISRIVRVNAWWYARRPAPSRRILVRDVDGIIYSYGAAHGLALNPVGTAGRWQRLNEGFSTVQLATALLDVGVSDPRGGRQTLTWEYYDVPGQPKVLRPAASGMAQARIARLMASAYRESADPRFLTAARDAMASLDVDVVSGGVRSLVAAPNSRETHPWYVERAYPGEEAWMGGALNGFMVAILELRTTADILRGASDGEGAAADAQRLADAGAQSLDRFLPLHDTGRWSYYGMLSPGHPFRTYQANVTYHCYHVTLLQSLAPAYPQYRFAATAETWGGYATRVGVTCPGGAPTASP